VCTIDASGRINDTSGQRTLKVPCTREVHERTVHDYGYVLPLAILETHLPGTRFEDAALWLVSPGHMTVLRLNTRP